MSNVIRQEHVAFAAHGVRAGEVGDNPAYIRVVVNNAESGFIELGFMVDEVKEIINILNEEISNVT